MLRNLLALRQIAKRTINTSSRRQFENKVPEKQKLFQVLKYFIGVTCKIRLLKVGGRR